MRSFLKYYILILILLLLSCDTQTKYTAEDIDKIQIKDSDLFGKIPSMQSEPLLVSDAVDNKLIDTPIRLIGTIESITDNYFQLEEGGEEVLVNFSGEGLNENTVSKLVLVEGVMSFKNSEFSFETKTVLILE